MMKGVGYSLHFSAKDEDVFCSVLSLSPLVINQLHNNLKRAMRLGSSQEWGGGGIKSKQEAKEAGRGHEKVQWE